MSGTSKKSKDDKHTARILVVDDHPLVRRGLADVMNSQEDFEVCCEAEDISTALKAFERGKPDLVLVDLKLGEESGLDLVRQLRSRSQSLGILVCSMYEESAFAERALRAGASGYVNKHESGSVVIEAVRDVLAGRIYLSGEFKDEVVRRITADPESANTNPLQSLSDREMQVFEMIGRGMSIR